MRQLIDRLPAGCQDYGALEHQARLQHPALATLCCFILELWTPEGLVFLLRYPLTVASCFILIEVSIRGTPVPCKNRKNR